MIITNNFSHNIISKVGIEELYFEASQEVFMEAYQDYDNLVVYDYLHIWL
jgi:hypothetical protein